MSRVAYTEEIANTLNYPTGELFGVARSCFLQERVLFPRRRQPYR